MDFTRTHSELPNQPIVHCLAVQHSVKSGDQSAGLADPTCCEGRYQEGELQEQVRGAGDWKEL